MYTRKKYSFKDVLLWTRWEILTFTIIAAVPAILYQVMELHWLRLPWTAFALIGTAVAFLIGFQNNAAYGRAWEARKIWGGIVNTSRSWSIMTRDLISNQHANVKLSEEELNQERQMLIDRHIAWLTALRHAMRQPRPWEVFKEFRTSKEWCEKMNIPELKSSLEEDLKPLLSDDEYAYVLGKTNRAAALLSLQSKHLKSLEERRLIWEFSFLEMEKLVVELFNLQGKSERIKNFPYPRQYATLSYDLVRIFILLLPFGLIPQFAEIGQSIVKTCPQIGASFIWVGVPFTVMISWVFHTLQKIGVVGENPFEGTANDVPISTISRGIEIDLREMMDEDPVNIPDPLPAIYEVQM